LIFETDLDIVKINQHAKYPRQRSSSSEIIVRKHRDEIRSQTNRFVWLRISSKVIGKDGDSDSMQHEDGAENGY